MGTFYVDCEVANHVDRKRTAHVNKVLVDTGSEYTWASADVLNAIGVEPEKKDVVFTMPNGQTITRNIGFPIVRVGEFFTIDEVVFGQKGDLNLLGARTLEGMNVSVDAQRKKLVAAGPLPAASAECTFS